MNVHKSATKLSTVLRLAAASSLAVLGLGLMSPAQAHDELISTNPEQGTSLVQAPQKLELTYSGELTDVEGSTQIRVTDSAGSEISSGDPKVKGKTVTQKIAGHGAENETYSVAWRVVSSDGHPIQGSYEFTVGEGKEAVSSTSSATETSASEDTGAETTKSNTGLKIGIFVLIAIAIIGAIGAVIAKTRRTQR